MKNMEKAALRKEILEKTDALPEEYIAESDRGIFEVVKSLPAFINARTIFTYYSLGREPDTVQLIEYALEMGKTVTLPVCFKCGIMEARPITCLGELSESSYHLLEPLSCTQVVGPEELDFAVVPALTYDNDGYRLGRGGGYYDRFLLKTKAFTAGLTRERLMVRSLPRESHDVPVQCVVTEKRARLPGSLA